MLLFRGFDRAFWFSIPSSPYPLAMALWIGCADIDFGNPTPRLAMWTVHKYIQTLKVKKEDLMGIAAVFESQNQVVRLTFHKQAACDAFLLEHQGIKKEKIDDRDFSIIIKDSNVQEKFVRISGIPYQMNLGILKTRFREFGNVLDLRWESYHVVDSEYLYPVLSTWLICRMALEKHIPSYVTIGSYKAVVRYSGQIPTCRICDDREHIGKNCPTLSKNRKVVPTKAPPVQKPARVEKSNNEQSEKSVTLENQNDGRKDVVGSENESVAPEPEMVDMEITIDTPEQVPSTEVQQTQVIPETQSCGRQVAQENPPPPVSDSANSEDQNKNTEERVDNMETDSASSSSFPPLPQSKIPSRVAHLPSANFIAVQGKSRRGKKPDASQQSSSGPPPRKTPKTQ